MNVRAYKRVLFSNSEERGVWKRCEQSIAPLSTSIVVGLIEKTALAMSVHNSCPLLSLGPCLTLISFAGRTTYERGTHDERTTSARRRQRQYSIVTKIYIHILIYFYPWIRNTRTYECCIHGLLAGLVAWHANTVQRGNRVTLGFDRVWGVCRSAGAAKYVAYANVVAVCTGRSISAHISTSRAKTTKNS